MRWRFRMVVFAAAVLRATAPAQAGEKMTCFASDAQVASGETILCRRGGETFYESLDALYESGWRLVIKLRVRNQKAHAFHLERPARRD